MTYQAEFVRFHRWATQFIPDCPGWTQKVLFWLETCRHLGWLPIDTSAGWTMLSPHETQQFRWLKLDTQPMLAVPLWPRKGEL